jgi:hypothetical protein
LLIRDLPHWKKNKHWLRVKGWKKIFQANGPHKQAGVAVLIFDKVDFRLKSIRRDNEGHFILMKGTIHQEEKYQSLTYIHQTWEHPSSLKNSNDPKSADRC